MAKKPIENKSSYISDDLMKRFTKITLDNVKQFYDVRSLFIILIQEGTKKDGFKYSIVNQFITRSQFIAGNNIVFSHVFDGDIVNRNVSIKTSESIEDYNIAMEGTRSLIKSYINKGVIYGIIL